MSQLIDIKVPDIGDFKDVPVIEVFVKVGDTVKAEDPLISLESDKATMDVPAPQGGVVKAITVKVGDKVSEGSVVMQFNGAAGAATPAAPEAAKPSVNAAPAPVNAPAGLAEVRVPDIGDFKDVPVIEVFVKPGDVVQTDDPLVTIESDKATMDVPAPIAGIVEGVRIGVGERVSEGTPLLTLKTSQTGPEPASRSTPPTEPANVDRAVPPIEGKQPPSPQPSPAGGRGSGEARERADPTPRTSPGGGESATSPRPPAEDESGAKASHASPSVRKFARELGVDLGRVTGSGPKGRILHEDVQQFVKRALAAPASGAAAAGGVAGGALNLLPWPSVDFAKFGPVEPKPLARIKRISGANLARNWVMIPHVTQFDEADITELEALRVALNKENEKAGVKLTMLAFLIKASVAALHRFPDFNASLDAGGESLVYKHYFNIGFAADTPNGLVVPVVKGADGKGVLQIATEMTELSAKAREGKLGPADMQGGCFSISSLGGIGGTAFTPIINAPEVAILGVSRSATKAVWDGKAFAPRLLLPLSLSYDHRVIDGAQAARFITYFGSVLADFRRALL
jgi:pyruvate dehydrogenase E2 component (dihydrolipoamide acetyltransferase)